MWCGIKNNKGQKTRNNRKKKKGKMQMGISPWQQQRENTRAPIPCSVSKAKQNKVSLPAARRRTARKRTHDENARYRSMHNSRRRRNTREDQKKKKRSQKSSTHPLNSQIHSNPLNNSPTSFSLIVFESNFLAKLPCWILLIPSPTLYASFASITKVYFLFSISFVLARKI